MKQLVVKANEVITYASRNVVMNGSDSLTATAKAVELATLKARLMRGEICKWAYKKVNGEIRVCVGTLFNDIVKSMVVGGNTPKKYFGQFAYIELFADGRMEWRSMRESNFVGTIEG
jgi:hypothetical protein